MKKYQIKVLPSKNHDRLKGDQTKERDRVELKGIDAYFIRHCARYWYYTNHENALYIENDDRRHTMHRANNRYANNTTYFAPIWEEINDEQFCKASFEFFATRKYKLENVLKSYDTKYKMEQKEHNLPNGIKFIKQFIEEDFMDCYVVNNKIKSSDLSNYYKQWCCDQGIKFHLGTFKTQIKRIGFDNPKSIKFDGVSCKGYSINIQKIEQIFKDLLKNNTFKFVIESNDKKKNYYQDLFIDN